jgi:hypothetical protein
VTEPTSSQLDELERVTREYAEGWKGGGWAWFVGAAVLASSGLRAALGATDDWQPFEMTGGGAVWLWALWRSRQWYQRRGAVVPQGRPEPGRVISQTAIYLGVALSILSLALHAHRVGDRPELILG